MKKKTLICALLIAALILAMVPQTSAFFNPPYCHDDGPSAAQLLTLKLMVRSTNNTISCLTRLAIRTPYNDVPWLLASVDALVDDVMDYAGYIGATVVCEYEYFWIDGQYVAIDPLKVVNV